LEGDGAIAEACLASFLVGLGGVGGLIGVVPSLIGAAVVDEAGLGVARGGMTANLSTGSGIAVAALAFLLLGWTRAWIVNRSGLVTGIGH